MKTVLMGLGCLALVTAGCVDEFPSGTTVKGVRVLAVRAEPAEPAPGEAVRLTALVATPGNDLEEVELDWSICLVPRSGAQPNPSPDACSDLALDGALQAQASTGQPAARPYELTVPGIEALDPDTLSQPDATGGIYLTVRLVTRRPGDDPLLVLYRLRLQLGPTTPNQNPELDGVPTVGGDPWAEGEVPRVAPGADLELEARWKDGAEEDFEVTLPGAEPVTGTETLSFAWFDDDGDVVPAHTGGAGEFTTRWRIPAGAEPGRRLQLWLVLRDNRGGATWLDRQVLVAAP